jgi:RNA polymerase sigma-70 factor (ECF subfamily)
MANLNDLRFETLIDEYHDEIYRYLWRLSLSGADPEAAAADLTQETYLRAYNAYSRLRSESNIRAWLYKIATNCARSRWRKQKRGESNVELARHDPSEKRDMNPESLLQSREQWDRISAAIDALPHKQRAAVHLRYLQELPYAELASVLGISEDSARANVYQGLRTLRQRLAREER